MAVNSETFISQSRSQPFSSFSSWLARIILRSLSHGQDSGLLGQGVTKYGGVAGKTFI